MQCEKAESRLTHAGAAQGGGVSIGLDADAEDVHAGGVNVDTLAKVGEGCADVGLGVNGTDSDGTGSRSGGSVGGVLLQSLLAQLWTFYRYTTDKSCGLLTYVLVSSSDDGDDTGSADGLDGAVDSLGERSAQRHVHNSLSGESLLLDVVDDELHAVQDARVAT